MCRYSTHEKRYGIEKDKVRLVKNGRRRRRSEAFVTSAEVLSSKVLKRERYFLVAKTNEYFPTSFIVISAKNLKRAHL